MTINEAEKELIIMLKDGIAQSMIEELIDDNVKPEDEMVASFIATILDTPKSAELLKAVGIAHFGDDREACLAISDFCGYLSDVAAVGREKLHN